MLSDSVKTTFLFKLKTNTYTEKCMDDTCTARWLLHTEHTQLIGSQIKSQNIPEVSFESLTHSPKVSTILT
jgi:hypothetical protein